MLSAFAYLYISVAFTCPAADVVNDTESWTRHDGLALNRAFVTCNDSYQACLKVFIKKGEQRYHAICRKPSNNLRR